MKTRRCLSVIAAIAIVVLPAAAQSSGWEPAIQAFEKRDAENPPEQGGILFVGSSSIRMWNTHGDFPDYDIINRGFGGSQVSDVLHYFDRIVLPYKPRLIAFYAGDNDIALGKSPETVIADTTTFIGRVHAALPDTSVIYIAIKPSIARWSMVDDMRSVNAAIAETAESDDRLAYLDVDAPMIGDDGKPREQLFIKDGLHMTAEGYRIWNDLIRPLLKASTAN